MNDFVNKLAKMVGFIAVGLFQLLYLKKKSTLLYSILVGNIELSTYTHQLLHCLNVPYLLAIQNML